jgi:hypothetical protein
MKSDMNGNLFEVNGFVKTGNPLEINLPIGNPT